MGQEQTPSFREPSGQRLSWRARLYITGVSLCLWTFFFVYFGDGHKTIVDFSSHDQFVTTAAPGAVKWWPCHEKSECGYMIVPKDYFNSSEGTASIAMLRIKATKYPKKGSIMLNPGGPGGSGVTLALRVRDELPSVLGEDWDLIGFDPRGIGNTKPSVQCFPSVAAHQLFHANTVFTHGYTVPHLHNASHPANRASLVYQSRDFLARKKAQAAGCAANMDVNDLRFMGTANVVRDMDFMAKILDGPEAKINYYGWSYGTILGAYLVNMLPNRIGFATIDGVADTISWANEPSHKWHRGWTSSAEASYNWFLNDCSQAGSASCPLANHTGEAPKHIQVRIEKFLQSLVLDPLPVPATDKRPPGVITSGMARGTLYTYLQRPRGQPDLALAMSKAMNGDGSHLFDISYRLPRGEDLTRFGVTCADSPPPTSELPAPTAEDMADELLKSLETSKHFGLSPIATDPDGGCQFWPTAGRGPERFTGPWNASLDYPLLIISNTADPITPIASGLLINSHMGNSSTLLIQNSPGHCSSASPSLCTAKVVKRFYAGHPPVNGTWCETDSKAFPDEKVSFGGLSSEDAQLLKALRHIEAALFENGA